MGLDVYLYRYENREETERLEAEYSEKSEANYSKHGGYDKMTEKQKDSVRKENKKLAASLGLNEWGDDNTNKKHIEESHPSYPDHYFKIGYFRSSYNDGGINSIAKKLNVPGLYEIFNVENSEYIFQPDWKLALARCEDAIEQWKAAPNVRCFQVSQNELSAGPEKLMSEADAIDTYMKRAKEFTPESEWFSTKGGHYMPKGLKVLAVLEGQRETLFSRSMMPCTYIIHEGDNQWYINALEIVRDTIKYVMDLPDKDKYFLHWSS